MTSIFLLMVSLAYADEPAPYFPRTFDNNNAVGAYNNNSLDITGRNRDNLVPIVKDNACISGQALIGATQKRGYIFGGDCSGVSLSSNSVTFPDGTVQTTAYPTASTMTWLSADYRNTTGIGVALTGSTVTYTGNGKRVHFTLSGGLAQAPNASFLCTVCRGTSTGVASTCSIAPYSATATMYRFENAENSSSGQSLSLEAESRVALSSGTLSFFVSCNTASGIGPNCSTYPCFFKVQDVP